MTNETQIKEVEKLDIIKMNEVYVLIEDFVYGYPYVYPNREIRLKKGERVKYTGKLSGGAGRFERVPMKEIDGRYEGTFIMTHKEVFRILRRK